MFSIHCCFFNIPKLKHFLFTTQYIYCDLRHIFKKKGPAMEMMQGASLLSRPAEEFGNDELVEEMWALKAMDHAEVYFNLLTSVHPSLLHLTPYDDQIYQVFRQDFPDLKIELLTDDILKSEDAKIRWRLFAEKFNKLEDYAYGTLLRADASKEFSPENSLLVVRIQFLAIEIARNREGLNDEVHRKFRPPPRTIIEELNTQQNGQVQDV